MSSLALPQPVSTAEYGLRRLIVVLGVVAAPLMETIDSSIVNVALPTVQGNLGATLDQGAWVVTGYLIANVCVIPLTPWLQSRFGRQRYFTATIVGFTLASMLCGMAGSITALILARILQGLFGGGLISTSQAALRDVFPPDQVGAAQGVFAIVVVIGPIIAPILGGYIVDSASWQWIFYVNLLPGLFSAAIVSTMLYDRQPARHSSVDVVGIALLVASLGSLQFMLGEGERRDWFSAPEITLAAVVAALAGIAFTSWELFGAEHPIVDLRVLRYRSVGVGSILAMGISVTLFGTIFVLPQFVQNVLGFTAEDAGRLLLVRAAAVMLMVPVVGGLVGSGRVDGRVVMGLGFTLTGVASLGLGFMTTPGTSFGHMVWPLLVGGFGSAMLFIPLLITVQSTTRHEDAASASAFIVLAFQLGGSITGAAAVTLIDRRADFHLDTIAGTTTLANPAVRTFLAHGTLGQLSQAVFAQAETMAFADTALAVGAIALILVPLVAIMKRQPRTMSGVSFE